MRSSNQSRPTRYVVIIAAIGIFAWSIYQQVKPQIEVGEMEYRLVSGIQDNTFKVIMLETNDQFTVHDTAFLQIFQSNDAEVVSRSEQLNLLQKYNDLQYRVNIYQYPKEEQAQFRTSREVFNMMKFKTNIKFQVDKKVRDSITAIIEM